MDTACLRYKKQLALDRKVGWWGQGRTTPTFPPSSEGLSMEGVLELRQSYE